MNIYYVYKHIRLDTGEVFYIGKGSGKRAYSINSRNKYWHNIVNKYGYKVEIVSFNLTEEHSFKLEIELINLLKPICNFSQGGAGRSGYKWTDAQIQKRTKSVLGKPRKNAGYKWKKDQKIKLSKSMIGKKHKDSKTVIDLITGKKYNNAKDACLELNLPWGSVYKMLKGERYNKTSLRYLEK